MIELLWAWRVLFGRVTLDDVPGPIRRKVAEYTEELRND